MARTVRSTFFEFWNLIIIINLTTKEMLNKKKAAEFWKESIVIF